MLLPMIPRDRQSLFQFVRYLSVGGGTAVIYFVLLVVFVQLLQVKHILAVSISYVCAISFHFLANKAFTFRNHDTDVILEVIRYLCVALTNYIITIAVVYCVVDWGQQSPYVGAVLAVAVTLGLGYVMTKYWVFHQKRDSL
jgi:putative flippase GtrA